MSGWTEERDDLLVAQRAIGATFAVIGRALGVTRNAAQGRYYRLTGLASAVKPRVYRLRSRTEVPRHRTYKTLAPSETPFAGDDSCPDFAWDDDHCAAVLALNPYPVMPRRTA